MKRVLMILITLMFSMTSSWSQETWLRTFGGTNRDYGQSLSATPDGGYVLTGTTASDDGDFEGSSRGASDVFVMKLDSRGDLAWKKTFGGSGEEAGQSITTTPDGGYVLTGTTASDDGDFEGMKRGVYDIFVVKLDSGGDVQWKKTFGGSDADLGLSISSAPDGGYVLTGSSKVGVYPAEFDIFIIKLDSGGDVQWKKTFGGSHDDISNSITVSLDGGCVIIGETNSRDGDFESVNRVWLRTDIFIIKLNAQGHLQWKRTFGGSEGDNGNCIATAPDGGYVLTGESRSKDGEFVGMNKGGFDIFVLKLDANGNLNIPTSVNDQTDNSSPLTVSPNPFSSVSNVSYSLDQPSHVRIEVVNSIGEVTAVLSDRQAEIGAHEVSLNATNLGTGTYWIRMVTDHQVFSKQVVLIR